MGLSIQSRKLMRSVVKLVHPDLFPEHAYERTMNTESLKVSHARSSYPGRVMPGVALRGEAGGNSPEGNVQSNGRCEIGRGRHGAAASGQQPCSTRPTQQCWIVAAVAARQALNKYVEELSERRRPRPARLEFYIKDRDGPGLALKKTTAQLGHSGSLSPLFFAFGLIERADLSDEPLNDPDVDFLFWLK